MNFLRPKFAKLMAKQVLVIQQGQTQSLSFWKLKQMSD